MANNLATNEYSVVFSQGGKISLQTKITGTLVKTGVLIDSWPNCHRNIQLLNFATLG